MLRLTEHFTLEELAHSELAVRLGIDNTPPADVVPHLVVLANGLEQIRRVTGHPLIVHSGYRCEALERVLCAKDFAAWCNRHGKDVATAWTEYFARKGHPRGYCGDFTCPGFGSPAEVVQVVRGAGIKVDQLIEEGTWVHASFAPELRGQILTARFDEHGVPTYAPA
jgi:zinc D-Ala-D-Ala carboxypeptidase